MAFENSKTKNKNKNLFVARLASKATGKTISWINLTEEFARKVFACELRLITAEQAETILPPLMSNEFMIVEITDTTAAIEVVPATEF